MDDQSAIHLHSDAVKDTMHENIDSMLSNLGKTEDIEQNTKRLQDQAQMFDRQSRVLKNRERCKNYKLTAAIAFAVILILIIIIASLVGKVGSVTNPTTSPPTASP